MVAILKQLIINFSFSTFREKLRFRLNLIDAYAKTIRPNNLLDIVFIAIPLAINICSAPFYIMGFLIIILFLVLSLLVNLSIKAILDMFTLIKQFINQINGYISTQLNYLSYEDILALPALFGSFFYTLFDRISLDYTFFLGKYNIRNIPLYLRTFFTIILFIFIQYVLLYIFKPIIIIYYFGILISMTYIIKPCLSFDLQEDLDDIINDFWLPYLIFLTIHPYYIDLEDDEEYVFGNFFLHEQKYGKEYFNDINGYTLLYNVDDINLILPLLDFSLDDPEVKDMTNFDDKSSSSLELTLIKKENGKI